MRPVHLLMILGSAYGCAFAVACANLPAAHSVCLPMKSYTAAQQQAVAAQLAALPPDSPVAGLVVDYGQLRAANRACAASHP